MREYIDECVARYKRIVGDFPERGALNARVVGKVKGSGYTIEKILFEVCPDGMSPLICIFRIMGRRNIRLRWNCAGMGFGEKALPRVRQGSWR